MGWAVAGACQFAAFWSLALETGLQSFKVGLQSHTLIYLFQTGAS